MAQHGAGEGHEGVSQEFGNLFRGRSAAVDRRSEEAGHGAAGAASVVFFGR